MNTSSNDINWRSVDQISGSQQSAKQQMLLNAIKNKFANNENHHGNLQPTFSIPCLKIPSLSTDNAFENNQSPSKLNQFILGQLGESKSLSSLGAFAIPNLRIPNNTNSTSPTLADKFILKDIASDKNIAALNKGISDLKVCDENKTSEIDLTLALNNSAKISQRANTPLTSIEPDPIDFQIPFIDCDIRESLIKLPTRDDYCQTDISKFVSNRYITTPSRFGRITCLKYKSPRRIRRIDHSFQFKHKITCFNFETKSPDDIVLASLRKYNKV